MYCWQLLNQGSPKESYVSPESWFAFLLLCVKLPNHKDIIVYNGFFFITCTLNLETLSEFYFTIWIFFKKMEAGKE